MERRAVKRIAVNLDARFFYGNLFYSGRISDLSEEGMFLNTRKCLPNGSMFVIVIRSENELFKVLASVRRMKKGNGCYDGMGIELVNPPENYKDYVTRMKDSAAALA
ncbi:MAG: PilZ domain-containing protein [Nitrospiraceae bacterium]|nr:MAG: PilZ domain-containing protein [Nitrospiraceae bacterium]